MQAFAAAAPIIVVLCGMAILRWPAAVAGLAGLGVALAVLVFDERIAAKLILGSTAEALFGAATILWIILPALALYELQQRSGALDRLRDALTQLSDDRPIQALLIAWFFGLFIEGAAGFGTPVALAAPLLVAMGYSPVRAVALALLGHAGGVSFGAIGTPTLTQVEMLGLAPSQLAGWIVALNALPVLLLALAVMRLAVDGPLQRKHVVMALLAALCFLAPSAFFAAFVGPELPTLGGALVGGWLFSRFARRRGPASEAPSVTLADIAPYLAVVALVLATRLVPVIKDALTGVQIAWAWDSFASQFAPLYHPGSMLALGLILSAFTFGRRAAILPSVAAAALRVGPVAVALVVMLCLARLMVNSGMTADLAEGARLAGPFWPLAAPFIGVLGSFVSGSATASNILFTEFQAATATALALPVAPIAAAQTLGAAIGNAIAPHNIIAGAATVGLAGRDGEVLARTLGPTVVYAAAGGACAVLIAIWMS